MALVAQLDTLDGVDEAVRDLYVERDGKFRLDVEGVEFPEDVERLKKALKTERRIRETAEKALAKIPADFDAHKWEELVALAEQGGNGANGGGGNGKPPEKPDPEPESDVVARVRASLEQRYKAKMDEKDQRNAELEAFVRRSTVERDLDTGLDALGIADPVYKRAARALIKERGPEATFEDGDYKATIKDELGEVHSLSDYIVNQWGKTPEADAFLPASGATGGGATGGAAGSGPRTRKKLSEMTDSEKNDLIDEVGLPEYKKLVATGR